MAFAFTWAWYDGSSWNDFAAGNMIGFYGSTTYGTKVQVGSYQDGMHLRTSSGTDTDACGSPHMDNIKYLTSTTCSINGGSSVNVSTITQNDCVRIKFTDGSTSVTTENGKFYAYDGTTDTNAPTGVTAQALEQGDSSWTACGGSGNAVSITDQSAAVTHYYYVAMSASPTSVGEKTNFAWKISLDYY